MAAGIGFSRVAGLAVCLALAFSPSPRAQEPRVDLNAIFAGGEPRTVAELKAMETHQRDLTARVMPSVVGVQIGAAQGSGVIVSKEGYVLTAAHVAGRPDRNVTLVFSDGRKVRGRTLGMDRGFDAGLIRILDPPPAGKDWPFVSLATDAVKPGQWCAALGHPGGYEAGRTPVLRVGRVLSVLKTVVVTDCPLVGGDSGGPLFDMQGRVIGVHSRIGVALTANMHVPVAAYRDQWDRLVSGEAWGHLPGQEPYIGVQGEPEAKDCRLSQVFPGTPAEKAGLKPGDVVTKFDGKDVGDFESLRNFVAASQPGRRVKLVVRRDGEERELELIIGRRDS